MKIASIITSSSDYPGHICNCIFTIGCNFRCGYCYNRSLVFPSEYPPAIDPSSVYNILNRRRSFTPYVCITGGEPTLQNGLLEFLLHLRNNGFIVKLDTNGSIPGILEEILESNVLSHIAMDIKGSEDFYRLQNTRYTDILRSIEIVRSFPSYEFRTTIVPGITNKETLLSISKLLEKEDTWYLQQFFPSENILDQTLLQIRPYSKSQALDLLSSILEVSNCKNIFLRNF